MDLPVLYDVYPAQEIVINECIMATANRTGLDPLILRAIRDHEQGDLGESLVNKNTTQDMGPFGINTIHLPELEERFGLSRYDIQNDACTNTFVAAWYLSRQIEAAGGDIWRGVGRYHSKNEKYAVKYRAHVKMAYARLMAKLRQKIMATRASADVFGQRVSQTAKAVAEQRDDGDANGS